VLDLYWSTQLTTFDSQGVVQYPAALFGPDVAKWPAWWADAMALLTRAKNEADAIEMRK
jgi:hypothetical protein